MDTKKLKTWYIIAKIICGAIISLSTLYIAWASYTQEKYNQPLEFSPSIELQFKNIEYSKIKDSDDYKKSLTFDFFINSDIHSGAIKSLYVIYSAKKNDDEPLTSFLKKDNDGFIRNISTLTKKHDYHKGNIQFSNIPTNRNFIQTSINLLAIDYNDNKHIIKQYFYFDLEQLSKIDSQAQAKKGTKIYPEEKQKKFNPILTKNVTENMVMSSTNQVITDMNAEIIDILKETEIEEKNYFLINRKQIAEEREVIIKEYNEFYKK